MTAFARRRSLARAKVHGLPEPGPVLLLTPSQHGVVNVMTMSWRMVLAFELRCVACVVSENDFNCAALYASRECALNLPTHERVSQVVGCSKTPAVVIGLVRRARRARIQCAA